MGKKVRIVVVDDSAFMRKAISMMLEEESTFEIVGTATNGEDAFSLVKTLKPDIITLDIEMPGMSGLEVLERIMNEIPTPVIMLSSLSTEGADETIKALELGAVDFIPKSISHVSLDIIKIKDSLIEKIKNIASRGKSVLRQPTLNRRKRDVLKINQENVGKMIRVVTIGISTGGPKALLDVIPLLPKEFPRPVMIVQHMPPKFTASLADRLNKLSDIRVKEAEFGETLQKGTVYIAPGGQHMTLRRNGSNIEIVVSGEPSDSLYKPSVDVMLNSVVDIYGSSTLSVIMTGMGKDGLEGSRRIHEKKGKIISESEESCTVYGMPKAVADAGIVDRVEDSLNIAEVIVDYVNQ